MQHLLLLSTRWFYLTADISNPECNGKMFLVIGSQWVMYSHPGSIWCKFIYLLLSNIRHWGYGIERERISTVFLKKLHIFHIKWGWNSWCITSSFSTQEYVENSKKIGRYKPGDGDGREMKSMVSWKFSVLYMKSWSPPRTQSQNGEKTTSCLFA